MWTPTINNYWWEWGKPSLPPTQRDIKQDVEYSTRPKMPQEAFDHLKDQDEHVGFYL